MLIFLFLYVCLGISVAHKSSKEAAIISESRYLNTAGQFGSAYSQEDGVEFQEHSNEEGYREGSYSYIDPNGQRKTVTYTAGRDGFQASGDHFPVPVNPIAILPQRTLPVNSENLQAVEQEPDSLQVQFQSIPGPGNPLLNLFELQPKSVTTSTEKQPIIARRYPPGKLNIKQTADGFSYTFNSII